MRRRLLSLAAALSFLIPLTSPAQQATGWFPVDTITAGPSEERNPTLTENCWGSLWNPGEVWVLFERWTPTESRIEGRRFLASTRRWDTLSSVIASVSLPDSLRFPALGEFSSWNHAPLRIAAWQHWSAGRWKIVASMATDSAATWSAPETLATGTEDCLTPLVRRFAGGPHLSWKRGNVIFGSVVTEAGFGTPDTLAVGTDSNLEYDIISDGGGGRDGIIWRSTTGDARNTIFYRVFHSNPFLPSVADTAILPFDFSAPRLGVNLYPIPSLFCNVGAEGARDILYYRGESYGWDFIADDPGADEANVRAFMAPVVTKPGSTPGTAIFYGDFGYERTVPGDSVLVFMHASQTDTVRSHGFNRNLRFGSPILPVGPAGIIAVWESNRTGKIHIYGRFLQIILGGVGPVPGLPDRAHLLPNYPNPFNPSTTISFELPQEADVILDVVDLPGRVVATLAEGRTPAGVHSVDFDGRGCGSGVYFCRLRTGSATLVRPMLLVK